MLAIASASNAQTFVCRVTDVSLDGYFSRLHYGERRRSAPLSGNFLVTMNGFHGNHQTRDDLPAHNNCGKHATSVLNIGCLPFCDSVPRWLCLKSRLGPKTRWLVLGTRTPSSAWSA